MRGAWGLLLAALITGPAAARAPETSLLPEARPAAAWPAGPKPRTLAAAAAAPAVSLQPPPRPEGLARQALFKRLKRRKGAVCGDTAIQGKPAGDIAGSRTGCGIKDAVRVREVAGVRLNREALMTCGAAKALKTWVKREVATAFGRRNRVVSMRVAAHYACRTRNNQPGAKISEHGRGRAIDISAFTLEDGQTVTVLEGWQKRRTRKRLKKIWKAACGPFGTVLGPEADRYHRDHFHLDVAPRRRRPYCR
ncbi:extensin family protein [Cribrihabitans pelagius]|uniref:extensin-like domain-containing protein n=1 Tax=Cribrihabitans pelagius TaxID=1765746 RepID=UPI003B59C403